MTNGLPSWVARRRGCSAYRPDRHGPRSSVTDRLGARWDEALQRVGHGAVAAASADQWLHHDLAGGPPEDPAAELAVLCVERNDLLVLPALDAVVERDHHVHVMEFCPSVQQHQIGDLERETHGHI